MSLGQIISQSYQTVAAQQRQAAAAQGDDHAEDHGTGDDAHQRKAGRIYIPALNRHAGQDRIGRKSDHCQGCGQNELHPLGLEIYLGRAKRYADARCHQVLRHLGRRAFVRPHDPATRALPGRTLRSLADDEPYQVLKELVDELVSKNSDFEVLNQSLAGSRAISDEVVRGYAQVRDSTVFDSGRKHFTRVSNDYDDESLSESDNSSLTSCNSAQSSLSGSVE